MELSMEGGGTLYTARWGEDRGPITIYRQTSSGRRMLEQLVPDPDGTWTAVHTPLTAEGQPICGEYAPDIHFTADSGLEAARQRLAELAALTCFDCSRLRKQPRHIYYTLEGGTEVCLTNIGLLRQQLEEEPIPLESLVTGEPFSSLLGRFATEELERLEMEWDQGRLVLCHDGDMYACLYFENNFGRGNYWYALLADAEMYRTIDCNDVVYVPFGMWKLAEYSIFHSVQNFLQDMECLVRWAGDSSRTADRAGGSGAVR